MLLSETRLNVFPELTVLFLMSGLACELTIMAHYWSKEYTYNSSIDSTVLVEHSTVTCNVRSIADFCVSTFQTLCFTLLSLLMGPLKEDGQSRQSCL